MGSPLKRSRGGDDVEARFLIPSKVSRVTAAAAATAAAALDGEQSLFGFLANVRLSVESLYREIREFA